MKSTLLCSLLLASTLSAITPEEEPVVKAVEKVHPAVVNIYTERIVERRDPFDEFFDNFFGSGIARGGRIIKQPVRSLGSGVLISADGYVVTNHHVIQRAPNVSIKVTLPDGKDYEAIAVTENPDLDLALIKVKSDKPLPFLSLKNLSPNLLGQTVIAIGNPVGYESSVSKGILSAKNRTLEFGSIRMEDLLQTDAAINPGNSGGPLIDINGNLVGINTAKMSMARNVTVENIGFAIPADAVRAFTIDAIAIAKGEKKKAPKESYVGVLKERFGIEVQNLTPDIARQMGLGQQRGLIVSNVLAGSAAEAANIERGMVIIAVGANRVRTIDELPPQLGKIKPKDAVRFTLRVQFQRGPFIALRTGSVLLQAQ